MNSIVSAWFLFTACLVLVAIAGPHLSRSGDVIAEKTGLSGSLVGVILMATVTSLPELTTGISAVTVADTPDIAVGDLFGSCVFNLAILIVLDFIQRGESVYRRIRHGHILSAGFGVVLIGFSGLSLLLHGRGASFAIGHVAGATPILLLLYAFAMRALFGYEAAMRRQAVEELPARYAERTLRSALGAYAIAAVVIVIVGTALPYVAALLAETMGWQQTFVGTLFVATVTSAPELVVSIAAVRIGAADLAVANLLGSNLFNMAVLGVDDLLYTRGPLLQSASPMHAVSAFSAVIMSGIVIVGIVYRSDRRLFRAVGWISLGLLTMYVLNTSMLFLYGV